METADANAPAESDAPLTLRAQQFVAEYLKDFNATQAAIRAGYSRRSAAVQGCRLLSNLNIRGAISDAAQDALKHSQAILARIKDELVQLAFFDPASMLDRNGHMRPLAQMKSEIRRGSVGLRENPGSGSKKSSISRRYDPFAKLAALNALMKLVMFANRLPDHLAPDDQDAEKDTQPERLPITVFHDAMRGMEEDVEFKDDPTPPGGEDDDPEKHSA